MIHHLLEKYWISSKIVINKRDKKYKKMDISNLEREEKKRINSIKIFPVPVALEEIKENIAINKNSPSKPSKEQLINEAFKFHAQGNILEAEKLYQFFIERGFTDHRVFSNFGAILRVLGRLDEAESVTRKAIELKPDFVCAYLNLGNILSDLGKLQDAEVLTRKLIEFKPDYADAYINLGNILRDLGKLQEGRLCSEKIMSLRSWSILGSYSFNYEMK